MWKKEGSSVLSPSGWMGLMDHNHREFSGSPYRRQPFYLRFTPDGLENMNTVDFDSPGGIIAHIAVYMEEHDAIPVYVFAVESKATDMGNTIRVLPGEMSIPIFDTVEEFAAWQENDARPGGSDEAPPWMYKLFGIDTK